MEISSNIESLFCNTCTRQFQRKHAYEQHVLCCPRLFVSSEKSEILPTQAQLYAMVLELHKKCNKMQNEIRSLRSMDRNEKKKIELIPWLQQNKNHNNTWEQLLHRAHVENNYIDDLKTQPLHIVMMCCINQIIDFESSPIIVFQHKKTSYFVRHENNIWKEYDYKILRELYKHIHSSLTSQVNDWAKNQGDDLYSNDHLSRIYNELIDKIIGGTSDDGLEKSYKKLDAELRKKCIVVL
jgi:hypothetical protein